MEHERMPVCSPKNSKASLAIFVLPIDRRSFIVPVLNELFVDPVAAVMPAPDFSKDEPACDRSPRDDHRP
jgi:hypothetical protein